MKTVAQNKFFKRGVRRRFEVERLRFLGTAKRSGEKSAARANCGERRECAASEEVALGGGARRRRRVGGDLGGDGANAVDLGRRGRVRPSGTSRGLDASGRRRAAKVKRNVFRKRDKTGRTRRF